MVAYPKFLQICLSQLNNIIFCDIYNIIQKFVVSYKKNKNKKKVNFAHQVCIDQKDSKNSNIVKIFKIKYNFKDYFAYYYFFYYFILWWKAEF